MRRLFGLGHRELLGVDIGTTAVRMVQFHRTDKGYGITGAGTCEIAPWEDDPVRHRMHTVAAIQHCLSRGGMNSRLAVCGLRGPGVAIRSFEFSGLSLEEIGSAVSLEAAQICPFSLQDSTLDYQVTSCEDGTTRGFWVAATQVLIDSTQQLAHEAGLRCVLMDIDGLALLNCLVLTQPQPIRAGPIEVPAQTTPNGSMVAILDVGDAYATIAVVDNTGQPFVRDIASRSQPILNHLALDTGMAAEEVQAALQNPLESAQSCSASSATQEAVRSGGTAVLEKSSLPDSLRHACTELVDQVATTLRYYAAQNGSTRISRVLVCGGLAGARTFVELLGTRLHVDVTPWNPLAEICQESEGPWEPLLQEVGSSLAVAAGLAMRSI